MDDVSAGAAAYLETAAAAALDEARRDHRAALTLFLAHVSH
jgi:hypothetical protein